MLIEHHVRDALVAHLGVDRSMLVGDVRLVEDLGLDSLGMTELLLVLEDELVISIPDPVQAELRTLDDLMAVVASQLAGHSGSAGSSPAPGASFSRQKRPA